MTITTPAIEGIKQRGSTDLGDKTLLDALDSCHLVGDARGYTFLDGEGVELRISLRQFLFEAPIPS